MNDQIWIDLARDCCTEANVRPDTIEIIAHWEQPYCYNAVFRLDGNHFLKLFGPTAEAQFHTERAVLTTLETHRFAAPRLITARERAAAPSYLIMSAVDGNTAEHLWDDLSPADQLDIARQLGTTIATLHRLPQEQLAAVEQQYGDRHQTVIRPIHKEAFPFIEAVQKIPLQQRHALIDFMRTEAITYLDSPLHLTHAELAHNHIYLSQTASRWQLSGIIDWAEAVIGPPEWDFVYLWHWTFTTSKRYPDAMRACLDAYFADKQPPERFARRCLAAMLHTPSAGSLLSQYIDQFVGTDDIIRDMTAYFYPAELFGSPD